MVSLFLVSLLLGGAAAQSAGTNPGPAASDTAGSSARFPLGNGTSTVGPTGTASARGTGILSTGVSQVTTSAAPAVEAMSTPSNVVQGALTLPAGPSTCTGSVVPFKTSIPVLGHSLSVWDSDPPFWYFNQPGHTFTFSTNTTGIALGNPFWDQASPPPVLPRQNGSSFTANISLGSGDGQLMFEVFSSNTTDMPPASDWNASVTPVAVGSTGNPLFWLDIEGSGPCKNPVPTDQSCASGTLQLNQANWLAYKVDDWFGNWVKTAGPFSSTSSMMTKFGSQFMNSVCGACTYDQPCQCTGSCSSLPNNGKGTDAERIWLAWKAMENLSNMINNIYESITVADTNALGNIGNIALDLVDQTIAVTQGTTPDDKMSKANQILGAISPWISFLAPLVAPEAPIAAGIFSTAMGFTQAMLTLEDQPGSAPITAQSQALNTVWSAQGALANYVSSLEGSVASLHDQIFTNGVNITTYLNNGVFVNRTLLGLDCDSCKQQSQAWTMQYLSLKTMNYVWWVQNVFISYVPYGTIISNSDGQPTEFTEDICAGVFLQNDPDLVWCHTDDAVAGTNLKPGMARLTYYDKLADGNSPQHPNPNQDEINSHSNGALNMTTAAPGYKSSRQFQTIDPNHPYTFNKTDVMASSLAGFAKYGFNGDGMSDLVSQIQYSTQAENVQDTIQQYQDMFKVSATTPGMFTLPVCVSYNLNYWPTIYGTDGKPQGDQWCVCNSPWSVDMHGNRFNTSTAPDLTTLVNYAYTLDGNQVYCSPDIWGGSAPGLTQDKMSPTVGSASW